MPLVNEATGNKEGATRDNIPGLGNVSRTACWEQLECRNGGPCICEMQVGDNQTRQARLPQRGLFDGGLRCWGSPSWLSLLP